MNDPGEYGGAGASPEIRRMDKRVWLGLLAIALLALVILAAVGIHIMIAGT